ncbi:hypothetical protein Skr01_54560 [Sphaerisporangium krabiense]|uniref:tyrosine-type recombinase/integrase n=1 Tax=Sphaerisporangium krabiense TaxID=763782 RepID=UPI0016090CC0|nr:hypothetical protein Skr01_54560 [Sphaerisporangium krabiense]
MPFPLDSSGCAPTGPTPHRPLRPSAVPSSLLGGDGRTPFPTKEEAVSDVARHAGESLRFHDLRHCYATWLVSDGVPVNDVAGLVGHERISTTLNRYTHASRDRNDRARAVFADFSLTPGQEIST